MQNLRIQGCRKRCAAAYGKKIKINQDLFTSCNPCRLHRNERFPSVEYPVPGYLQCFESQELPLASLLGPYPGYYYCPVPRVPRVPAYRGIPAQRWRGTNTTMTLGTRLPRYPVTRGGTEMGNFVPPDRDRSNRTCENAEDWSKIFCNPRDSLRQFGSQLHYPRSQSRVFRQGYYPGTRVPGYPGTSDYSN
eukprot:209484-Rhodomonas_salina.2